MTYSTIMVHLDGARDNKGVLDAAATLAKRYDAQVIGIAACQPVELGMCDGVMDGALAALERDIVTDELAHAKVEFYAHAGLKAHPIEWRSIPTLVNIAHVIAREARCADLVITSIGPAPGNLATHADTGDLILRAGRPVLVVPGANVAVDFDTVIVAWAETRECRRAITDALPVLHCAERVILVDVSSDPVSAGDDVKDVAHWLVRRGIDADRIVARPKGSSARTLASIADETKADLVVAGGYGHSRVREWALGGVTRDLLLHERRCTLFSH